MVIIIMVIIYNVYKNTACWTPMLPTKRCIPRDFLMRPAQRAAVGIPAHLDAVRVAIVYKGLERRELVGVDQGEAQMHRVVAGRCLGLRRNSSPSLHRCPRGCSQNQAVTFSPAVHGQALRIPNALH